MGAAALHPEWKLCRGIEILQGISDVAQTKLESCREQDSSVSDDMVTEEEQEDEDEWVENEHGLLVKKEVTQEETETIPVDDDVLDKPPTYSLPVGEDNDRLPLAPVEFVCGSFEDPYLYFGDVDCVFCFSSFLISLFNSFSVIFNNVSEPDISLSTSFLLFLYTDGNSKFWSASQAKSLLKLLY